ncbi:MAG TPA: hypothetical protein VFS31_04485 [Chitinophagaceae bacterium]|nr:hypothetical protein [Chitinophagaceae bacterium]
MKKLISLSLVIASCYLLSCQKETLEDKAMDNQQIVASIAKVQKALPFKGTYTTSSEILQPAPFLHTRITGIGEASHLGNGSFVALSALDLSTAPPFQLGGTATFTAANGDEFYTIFTGTATPSGQGALNISMSHTITGGTGKFKKAEGSFEGNTVAVPGHAEASIDYEGTISY